MASLAGSSLDVHSPANEVFRRSLKHLLERVERTPALDEPFGHIYLENLLPQDIYERVLKSFPDSNLYATANPRHHTKGEAKGYFTRAMFALTPDNLAKLSLAQQHVWQGIAAALTAPELKQAVYAKLARDLSFRYRVQRSEVPDLAGHSRPTLYRETDGFEIPPHPDTRKKIVTMHLYLPADRSQLDLGTALYRRNLLAWPFGPWQKRFVKVKQFSFEPNSAYAFVVNNTLSRKSWHGRERLRDGAGVRNTLLNTFYEEAREEFCWKPLAA
jgi:hypothetical protein